MIIKLKIDQIRIDGGTQNRVEINQETVREYAESITEGATFPPVAVFFDGVDYWLADGFHRYHAHSHVGALDIDAETITGTQRDAVLYSVGVNATHGLKRSNADKRKAVETLLNDPEWSKWSDREIARQCSVSNHLVANIRKYHLGEFPDSKSHLGESTEDKSNVRKVERNGKTYEQDTSNIGKSRQQKPLEDKTDLKVVEQPKEEFDEKEQIISEQSDLIVELEEENKKLRDALAIGQIPEGLEIEDADSVIDALRARVKQLEIELKAVTDSRNSYLRENSQLKEQIRRQSAQLKKMGGVSNA